MASGSKTSDPALERAIRKDADDFIREIEVERIMKAFKLNPYDILDLPVASTESDVKKQYRKKSMLIHPDKFKHKDGVEAFDFLKKAEDALSDPAKRSDIDNVMAHARRQVLVEILPPGVLTFQVLDDDPRISNLIPPLDSRIRSKAKEVFVEEELAKRRAQKLTYANEGAEAAKVDTERTDRKRKKEEEAAWESRREERISGWRDFSKGGGSKSTEGGQAKKKKKSHVLG